MKRNNLIYIGATTLLLSGCANDSLLGEPGSDNSPKVAVTLEAGYADTDATRTDIDGTTTVWSEQDQIGIFTTESKAPELFSLSQGAGTKTAKFEGTVAADNGDMLYALYPYREDPYELDIDPKAARIYFNPQTQDGFAGNARKHLGKFDYMAAPPVTFADGKVSSTLSFRHLATLMEFSFSLPEDVKVRFLTLSTSTAKLYDQGVVDLTATNPVASKWGTATRTLSMGFDNANVQANEKVTAYMMMLPQDLTADKITFYVSGELADGTPVTYSTVKNKGAKFEAGKRYHTDLTGFTRVDTKFDMVYVPGGSLNICALAQSEDADIRAIVDKDYKVDSFWIGRTEVTNQQFCDFLNDRKPNDVMLPAWLASNGAFAFEAPEWLQIELKNGKWVPKEGKIYDGNGGHTYGSYANYPMIGVTPAGASAYNFYLVEQWLGYPDQGSDPILPSELQWEYAATGSEWNPRALSDLFPGSNDMDEVAWHAWNCESAGSSCIKTGLPNQSGVMVMSEIGGSHPVASKKPNFLGLYDMAGNAGEICADWYSETTYPCGQSLNPKCTDISLAEDFYGEECRSLRGGSWALYPQYGITYTRDFIVSTYSTDNSGFRAMIPLKR